MKIIVHPSNERGSANHGWLRAKHSFSFSSWYDPNKVQFGALRVLNDDVIAPNMGFGTHPHDNMEIITIPLSGSISHQDSMGNGSVVHTGEIQVMSAGSGVQHSEYNPDPSAELSLFQIWILPNKRNVEPRYDQLPYDLSEEKNQFVQVVGPNPSDKGTWIHQNAWIHLAEINTKTSLTYQMKQSGNGVYIMIIEGSAEIGSEFLNKRDAIGVWDTDSIEIKTNSSSKLIAIEVPMS
jgi:hypothetical protein